VFPDGRWEGVKNWRDRGRCKGTDPDVFYPEDDDDPALVAKTICAPCMVREACLEHAITRRERMGVWGGYTAKERRRLIRQRRRAG
jgi:WhiB family redox-sensing transcriptional regulator